MKTINSHATPLGNSNKNQKLKNMKPIFFMILVLLQISLFAQDFPLVLDKQGTFKILTRTDYARGSNFTQTEMAANLEQLKKLIAIVQKNPVLEGLQGFNAQVNLDDISSVVKCGYGIPVNVEFEFCAFFKNKKGNVVFNTIEPPEWELQVNCMNGIGINSNNFDQNKCYFSVPFNKKTIAPGIDVYDNDCYVLYDPSRPPYWIPVMVNEAFALAREFNEKETNEYALKLKREMLDKEWVEIPASDRNKPAYYGGLLSKVRSSPDYEGQKNIFPPIMTVNPKYWNTSRPKSDIQFIVFHIRDKNELKRTADDYLKHQSTSYPCILFEQAMDIDFVKSLTTLISK
jgi:hypothetical protein